MNYMPFSFFPIALVLFTCCLHNFLLFLYCLTDKEFKLTIKLNTSDFKLLFERLFLNSRLLDASFRFLRNRLYSRSIEHISSYLIVSCFGLAAVFWRSPCSFLLVQETSSETSRLCHDFCEVNKMDTHAEVTV